MTIVVKKALLCYVYKRLLFESAQYATMENIFVHLAHSGCSPIFDTFDTCL